MRLVESKKRLACQCGIFIALGFIIPKLAYAGQIGEEMGMIDRMALLIMQIAVILFAAWLGGEFFRRWRQPEVLGEVLAGIVIGPFMLGALPLPGFAQGVFPLAGAFPVSLELYCLATIASILLLFLVGLETDIQTFFKFSLSGFAVGIGGVVASFILGDLVGVVFSQQLFGAPHGFFDFQPMFLGVVSTATSVGITARILSEKKKMDTPEGITILSGAVIDDVLGIIVLSVVVGIIKHGRVDVNELLLITGKAFGIWIGFTALGLIFSRHISQFVKTFKDRTSISVMSFALALFLAGVFEKSGLAMIIGAYVMGISFAKTDLAFTILENLATLRRFLIPIFFCVMGMLVDIRAMFSSVPVVVIGLVFTVSAILAKIIGCSIPALFFNFNARGALRIGVGMVPRGEVALIVAGIGLSTGALQHEAFSISLLMIFLTTMVTPPLLARLLASDKPGLRKGHEALTDRREERYDMPNSETAELVLGKIITAFEGEGFYVNLIESGEKFYHIRKDETFIILKYAPPEISFSCAAEDLTFIHTLMYEAFAELDRVIKNIRAIGNKGQLGRKIFETEQNASGNGGEKNGFRFEGVIHPLAVAASLRGSSKKEIIAELVDLLVTSGQLSQDGRAEVLNDVMDREATMSTGMQDGIALPHARTDVISHIVCSIGVKKTGVDFSSLDGKPSTIFVLTLAPRQSSEPYLQFMAEISKELVDDEHRRKLLDCSSNEALYRLLAGK